MANNAPWHLGQPSPNRGKQMSVDPASSESSHRVPHPALAHWCFSRRDRLFFSLSRPRRCAHALLVGVVAQIHHSVSSCVSTFVNSIARLGPQRHVRPLRLLARGSRSRSRSNRTTNHRRKTLELQAGREMKCTPKSNRSHPAMTFTFLPRRRLGLASGLQKIVHN